MAPGLGSATPPEVCLLLDGPDPGSPMATKLTRIHTLARDSDRYCEQQPLGCCRPEGKNASRRRHAEDVTAATLAPAIARKLAVSSSCLLASLLTRFLPLFDVVSFFSSVHFAAIRQLVSQKAQDNAEASLEDQSSLFPRERKKGRGSAAATR